MASSIADLPSADLQACLSAIQRQHPDLSEYLDAAVEAALRTGSPIERHENYLVTVARNVRYHENLRNRRIAVFSELEYDEYLPDFPDPQAEIEFERIEQDNLPCRHLEWLQFARAHLSARSVTNARNKYGKKERTAWERRLKILDLFVVLAENDEYDHKTGPVTRWMQDKLAADGILVEPETIAYDISAVRAVVADFVAYARKRRVEDRKRKSDP